MKYLIGIMLIGMLASCGDVTEADSKKDLSVDDIVIDDLESVEEYLDARIQLYNISSQYKIELERICEDSKSIEERTSRIGKLEKSANHELIIEKIDEVRRKMNRTFMPGAIEDADNFDEFEKALDRWKSIKLSCPSKFMEDLFDNCIESEYDCDCWSNKIREYFKNDKNYVDWFANSYALPDELITSLSDCSNSDDFDY